MKTGFKRLFVLFFFPYADGACAERLGGISDETAQVAGQEQAPAGKQGRITYRVICPPGGEALPECGQPPVGDSFDAAQPQQVAPEKAEAPAMIETQEKQQEQTGQESPQAGTVKPVAAPQKTAHKKHAKKSAKKSRKAKKR